MGCEQTGLLKAVVPLGHCAVAGAVQDHPARSDPHVCWTHVGAVVEFGPAVQVATLPAAQVMPASCDAQVG